MDQLFRIFGIVITGIPFVLGVAFALVRYVTDPIKADLKAHLEKDDIIQQGILHAIDRIEQKIDRLTEHLLRH